MECVNPFPLRIGIKTHMLPCGKCLVCLQSKRNDWAFRLTEEYKASKSAYFVTLTYDRQHLPPDGSLVKRDLQLYFKRLRFNDQTTKIRYYAVGEYGSKGARPHYHALIFNTNEENIRKSWGQGIVHVGNVTLASTAYVLKYLVQPDIPPQKKRLNDVTGKWEDVYQKPFALMSRGYGIGAAYLSDAMASWHRSGGKNYAIVPGTNTKIRLPRYYKELIWPKRYLPYQTIMRASAKKKSSKSPKDTNTFDRVSRTTGRTLVRQYVTTLTDGLVIPGRIPLETVEYTERERVFNKSAWEGRKAIRAERQWFWRAYGKEGMAKYKEHRNALLATIKTKVAFTQTF